MSIRVIKNYRRLATTPLRRDALDIVEAGYESIDLKHIFGRVVTLTKHDLVINGHTYDLSKYENIYVVGIGKGSALAVEGLQKVLKRRIKSGFAIDIRRRIMPRIKVFIGTHPLPSDQNIAATNKIIELLKSAGENDLILSVICGGGSSLFCQPAGLTCVQLQQVTDYLLKGGAKIQEINTIRKHLSLIHGGYFAQYAFPATVAAMIISDVPGDDLNFVASGPTVLDKTTKADAQRIAKKYKLGGLSFTETPKEAKYFKKITNIMIGNGRSVVEAMSAQAIALGYKPRVYSYNLSGLAKEVGITMAADVRPGEALLACGETQVIVTHPGKGGRNQDVFLSAASSLPQNAAIISAASDGKDNIPVAGALIDNPTGLAALSKHGINALDAVDKNAGYAALHKIGAHLEIRKVTANISDLFV